MKKLHLIILLVSVAMSSLAQTVGEAFYIYRNDGEFNAFFRDEVDSIAYSNYDTDSIYFDEAVMQVVYTQDSIYRIPLAAIDSVGFVQPKTVFQEDTHDLSNELRDYVMSVDSMTIYLRSDTPFRLLPKIGDKLAHLGFSDLFPDGFVGEVVNVSASGDKISIDCKGIPIEDAVKKFYGVYRLTAVADASRQVNIRRADSKVIFDRVIHVGTIPIKVNLNWFKDIWKEKEFLEGLKYGAKGELQIEAEPIFDIKVAFCKDDFVGIIPFYNAHVVSDFSLTEDVKIMGEIKGEKKYPFKLPSVLDKLKDYPIGPGVTFYVDGGIKFEGNGDVGIGASFEQSGRFSLDINFYPIPPYGYPLAFLPLNTLNHKASMRGHKEEWLYLLGEFEYTFGFYFEFGFGFVNHKISKIGAEFSAGVKCDGMVKFNPFAWEKSERTTDFYESCSESKLDFDIYLGSEGLIACFDERLKFSKEGKINLPWFHDESFLLPTFSNVKLSPIGGSLLASSDVSGKCLFPLQLGFALFDEKGDLEQLKDYKNVKYWTSKSFSNYTISFDNIPMDAKYTTYPTINFLGRDILASPSAEMWLDFPVTLSDFKVTKSQYQKGAFTNDGKTYDYRFDVSVTAKLDNSEGVADWGYVYRDPNGQEAFISLKQFGNSKKDDRWAYFRNGTPPFTCTLYGYVKYVGSDEPVYGEPHDYPLEYSLTLCPDENHPHMIDLGLPSGTKWACCNIGASEPKEVGGYYAWGELETKSQYGDETYKYFIKYVNSQYGDWFVPVYTYIGTDISGTDYDVAHVKWGNGWRMPTMDEMKELKNYCSSSWFNLNGKEGRLYIGQNGNMIFLPAGGWYTNTFSSSNNYWSSTLDPGQTNCESSKYGWWPYVLDIDANDNYDYYCTRGGGIPVRPITSGNVGYSRKNLYRNAKQMETNKEWRPVIENGIVIKY